MQNEQQTSPWRFVRTFLIVIAILIVFAYGFQVTRINLEEPKEPQRQQQLTNVLRALARPDLTEYEIERLEIEAPILIPCPATQFSLPELSQPGPSIRLSTQCASPGAELRVSGSGFEPGEDLFLYFVPYTEIADEEIELKLVQDVIEADREGGFSQTVELRSGRTSEEPQKVRVVVNRRQGLPSPSVSVHDTFEKIIETIFLALIATTLGTLISIPVSFLAARNLMIQVTSVFGSLVTVIALAPVGWLLGAWLFGRLGGWGVNLIVGGELPAATALWAPALLLFSVQAMATQAGRANRFARVRSYILGIIGAVVVALVAGLVAGLGLVVGANLTSALGDFGFLGNFIFVVSDTVVTLMPLIGGLTGLFTFASLAGVSSENFLLHMGSTPLARVFSIVMAILAGAVLFAVPASLITWLYQLSDRTLSIGLPALIGAVVVGLLAVVVSPDRPMPTGMIVYYASRTVLNVLRAIEPLIMAIVFVVWVGIGPFAGVMALMLHTIAALGKLYSEQVENIAQGPIEAVTATGANRLQTIIYAVIPQIVPPYIAFTIYRWDINVRMSTIIGFAGGGGIGFLLQQNLNLLKYRQASVQMIAIAIVVSTLDLVSAKIRERIV
jgi:phosphonate ABC transporter permease subunit PhnE